MNKLLESIFSSMVKSAVDSGSLSLAGKSKGEQSDLVKEYLLDVARGNVELSMIIDHSDSILKEARKYYRNNQFYFAIVFYSMWFEHAVNNIVHQALVARGFTATEASELFKSINNVKAKNTWLIKLLNLPKLNIRHLATISNIQSLRNEYVHYKWKPEKLDDTSKDERIIKYLKYAEKSVRYLKNYRSRNIEKISKKRVKELL